MGKIGLLLVVNYEFFISASQSRNPKLEIIPQSQSQNSN
jgi:hypothetical protein